MKINRVRIREWVEKQLLLRPGGYLGGKEYDRWTAEDADHIVTSSVIVYFALCIHFESPLSPFQVLLESASKGSNIAMKD